MKTLQLKDGLYWNGVLDPNLRVFDIIMYTEFGTTYNSYVLKGSEKTVLFETAKLKFWDDYKASIDDIVDIKDVDYIVMNHTEPDHAGSIAKLIELNPKITVVATGTAISFLKEIINFDFNSHAIVEGETLSLGDKTLSFMVLPNLHWPDTMYTYVEEDGVLFTCDSFGSHYSHEGILRSTVTDTEGYLRATKYYFDNIIGPFKDKYMNAALERIKDLDINMICPGHGPVLDSHIDELIKLYTEWCTPAAKHDKKLVVMPYVSAYGYTAELAEHIANGIKDSGDIDVHMFDMVTADTAVVQGEMAIADGLLFGTPTIVGEALSPIWNLVTGMFAPVHGGKLASAFGSYGWSGEGVPNIVGRLKQLRMKVVDGFKVRFKPSEVQLIDAYDFGYNFGCTLLKKENPRKAASSGGKKMMKCMVCGEVFDASLESCPVCGVGPDKFVEVESTATDFRKDTDERFIILGGGPGAHYAAAAIRERNATATIVIITDEKDLPYNRPMLTKAVLADFSNNSFAIATPEWYKENNIYVALDNKVVSVDTEGKEVICENAKFSYTKLIYALGAYCFVPPIKGSDADHVVSIRKISDTDKIKKILAERNAGKVVVIGGGVMGLEGAWELKKGGYDVTVLETAPGLLPKQLDDPASAMLEDIANKSGLKVVCGASITEITENEVILADGSKYEAQLVIMSTGMRPYTAIAQEAGINVDKLVVVDENMATNIPDVYACGDCVEFNGQQQAFWAQAVETGRIAGANAAGEELTYTAIGSSLVINAMNTSIFALGTNGKDPDKKFKTIEIKDTQRNNYEKYYFHNNVLVGVILIGDTSKMVDLTKAIADGATFAEIAAK
jgi:flavorubredoxin/NADPH-dependent 2,4-dienoyl-CoA reductase/sulfur reductase-like enzyme